jgi:hypothetical protein
MRKSRFFGGVAHAHARRGIVSLKAPKENISSITLLRPIFIFFFKLENDTHLTKVGHKLKKKFFFSETKKKWKMKKSVPETPWPTYKHCIKDPGAIIRIKKFLILTLPRAVFKERCTTFAHIDPDWLKILRVYLRLLKELALKDGNELSVHLEAARDDNGTIVDYTFFGLYCGALDVDKAFAKMLKQANNEMKTFETSRYRFLGPPDNWKAVGSFENAEWIRLLTIYKRIENPDLQSRCCGRLNSDGHPARATFFFGLGNAMNNRSKNLRESQLGVNGRNYIRQDPREEIYDTIIFPEPQDVYTISTNDVQSDGLENRLLPEIQCQQLNRSSQFLSACMRMINPTSTQSTNSDYVPCDDIDAGIFADLDRKVLGVEIDREDHMGEAHYAPPTVNEGKGSIYTRIGKGSNVTRAGIARIAAKVEPFSSLRNPILAARKLYLEHQDEIFETYIHHCRGNFDNLSRTGSIIIKFIKDGGANPPPQSIGNTFDDIKLDEHLTPFANYQAYLLRAFVRVFAAAESSGALINLIRNYMLDAFFVEKRMHLSLLANSWTGSRSKSFSARCAIFTFPEDVVQTYSYMSEKALHATQGKENMNDAIFLFDDVDPQMLDQKQGSGKASSYEALLKFILSESMIRSLRNAENPDGPGRIMESVNAEFSHCFIFLGNLKWILSRLMAQALRSRIHHKDINENCDSTLVVKDSCNGEFRTGRHQQDGAKTLPFRQELWRQSAIFFEVTKLIHCGGLTPPTTWMIGVILPYIDEWLAANSYPQYAIRDAERIANLATIKCIQDAIYRLFIRKGAKYANVPYDVNKLKELDPMLTISVQHVVNTLGEQADLICHPHEKNIVWALEEIWKRQATMTFWTEDVTYMRIDLQGRETRGDDGSRFDIDASCSMQFVSLAFKICHFLRARQGEGVPVPSPDTVCDFLNSLCERTARCNTWSKVPIEDGSSSTLDPNEERPHNPSEARRAETGIQYKAKRNGNETRAVRQLAYVLNKHNVTSLAIQADYLREQQRKSHTEILGRAIKDCLAHRHQSARKLIFAPDDDHPILYSVLDCPEASDSAPVLSVFEAIVLSENGAPIQEELKITNDLDVLAVEKRNKDLYINPKPLQRIPYNGRDENGEVDQEPPPSFFNQPLSITTGFSDDRERLAMLDHYDPHLPDDDFDEASYCLLDGTPHLENLPRSQYKLWANIPEVDSNLYYQQTNFEDHVYPDDAKDVWTKAKDSIRQKRKRNEELH